MRWEALPADVGSPWGTEGAAESRQAQDTEGGWAGGEMGLAQCQRELQRVASSFQEAGGAALSRGRTGTVLPSLKPWQEGPAAKTGREASAMRGGRCSASSRYPGAALPHPPCSEPRAAGPAPGASAAGLSRVHRLESDAIRVPRSLAV